MPLPVALAAIGKGALAVGAKLAVVGKAIAKGAAAVGRAVIGGAKGAAAVAKPAVATATKAAGSGLGKAAGFKMGKMALFSRIMSRGRSHSNDNQDTSSNRQHSQPGEIRVVYQMPAAKEQAAPKWKKSKENVINIYADKVVINNGVPELTPEQKAAMYRQLSQRAAA